MKTEQKDIADKLMEHCNNLVKQNESGFTLGEASYNKGNYNVQDVIKKSVTNYGEYEGPHYRRIDSKE